jgi:hypothetical protein
MARTGWTLTVDATPQLVVGAALTMRVRNPLVAVGIGVVAHAVLDAIPHYHLAWIMGFSRLALVDIAVGTSLALVIIAMAPAPWGSLAGAIGGVLPEIERVLTRQRYDFLERPPLELPHTMAGLPWGVVTQVAVTALALALAIGLRRGREYHP